MFKKLINFIKYHNAFTIGLILVLLATASAWATSDKIVKISGVDNSALIAADLTNFDLLLTIINVFEDDENYYISYEFTTLDIKDNTWQTVTKENAFDVSKVGLGARDLGLYVQEELGEVVYWELVRLKETQENEQSKGQTKIVETTKYTGLKGLVLSSKTKELVGYEPIVHPVRKETSNGAQTSEPSQPSQSSAPEIIIDTVIDSHPEQETTSTIAVFEFHSDKQNCVFQCKINTLDWANCESPKTYSGLTIGDYEFKVFATNQQGKYDPSPATFTWTIIKQPIEPVVVTATEPVATTTDPVATTTEPTE